MIVHTPSTKHTKQWTIEAECTLCFNGSDAPRLKSLAFVMNYGLSSSCFIILMTWDQLLGQTVGHYTAKYAPQKVCLESLILLRTWQISWQGIDLNQAFQTQFVKNLKENMYKKWKKKTFFVNSICLCCFISQVTLDSHVKKKMCSCKECCKHTCVRGQRELKTANQTRCYSVTCANCVGLTTIVGSRQGMQSQSLQNVHKQSQQKGSARKIQPKANTCI